MSARERRPSAPEEVAPRRRFRIMLGLLGGTALRLLLMLALMGAWWVSVSGPGDRVRPPLPAPPTPVAVLPARLERWSHSLLLPASVPPRSVWRIAARTSGRVAQVRVRPGERVQAGQVVARIVTAAPSASPRPRAGERSGRVLHGATAAFTTQAPARTRARQYVVRAQQEHSTAGVALMMAGEARARSVARRDALRKAAAEAERRLARASTESRRPQAALWEGSGFHLAGSNWRPGYDSDRYFHGVLPWHLARTRADARAASAVAHAATAAVFHADEAVRASRERYQRAETVLAEAREALQAQISAPQPTDVIQSRPVAMTKPVDVRADSAGIAMRVTAAPGAWTEPGRALVWMARPSEVRYHVETAASDLRGVRPGAPARILVGGATIPARVRTVRGVAGGRRVAVAVAAAGSTLRIVDSDRARVEITAPVSEAVLVAPATAVVRVSERAAVWVAQQEQAQDTWTARRLLVRLGETRDGKVAIHGGLQPGAQVIVAGMERLRDGQPVAVVPWNLP
jgi:multidrug efflux pump subunit AcrA (membrane-fusion protein)